MPQAPILAFPLVIGGVTYAMGAADLGHVLSLLTLLENVDYLRFCKTGFLHGLFLLWCQSCHKSLLLRCDFSGEAYALTLLVIILRYVR